MRMAWNKDFGWRTAHCGSVTFISTECYSMPRTFITTDFPLFKSSGVFGMGKKNAPSIDETFSCNIQYVLLMNDYLLNQKWLLTSG